MFVDQVKLKVKAGKGGDGMVSFRREKYVDKGGPSGGNGGKGGDVVFVGDEGLSTLLDLRYNKILKASDGEHGKSKNQHGMNSDPLIVKVPVGTTVYDAETDKVIGDIVRNKQELRVAKSGRGGRGNKAFVSSRNTAPEISERGEPGEQLAIKAELKVLADVGLVGFPSVGKSTIISVVSDAKPKIADYHFTTIIPKLGVVGTSDNRSFVMADLPGLIEGANQGVGLGLQFLRHIERTKVILHVVDMSGIEGRDPYDDFIKINKELSGYKYDILKKKQVIVANKMDLPNSTENLKEFKKKIEDKYEIFEVSAITKKGFDVLLLSVADILESEREVKLYDTEEYVTHVDYIFEPEDDPFEIERDEFGNFLLTGEKLGKLFEMTNFAKDEGIRKFSRQLRSMGVDDALRREGIKSGDLVKIFDYEFEFID